MSDAEPLLDTRSGGLTVPTTAVFIVGEIAGTGILAIPKAVEDTGVIGPVLILFFTVVSAYTGYLIGKAWVIAADIFDDCKEHVADPYPMLGEKTYGKLGKYTVSFSINVSLFGGATVFLLIASGNVENLVSKLGVNISFCFWLLIIAAVLLPFTWFGTPKDFWPIAVGASVATTSACVILVILAIMDSQSNTTKVTHSDFDLQNFSMALGTIVFGLAGHPAFPTFQIDMKRQSDFKWAVILGFVVIFCMYIPVALAGYIVYGSELKGNILDTVSSGTLAYAILIFITIHLLLAFIIVLNPVCQELEKKLNVPKTLTWKRCVTRTLVVGCVLFVAESIPKFNAILSLLGGSVLVILDFICPCLFYMKICQLQHIAVEKASKLTENSLQVQLPRDGKVFLPLWLKVLNYEIVALGVVIGIAASVSAFVSIVSPHSFSVPCYINITSANTG